jgi:predicted RND superfamily exporter protein
MFETILRADYQPGSIYASGVLPDGLMSNIVEFTEENYMVFTSVLMSTDKQKQINDIMASVPHTVVVDPFYYTNNMVELLNDDFNTVLGISSLFVFIVLLLSYRSISRALLAFMPMFLSWYIVQGIMGIFGLQFNLINIVISSFIFGVGVDYSIFIMDGMFANTRRDDITLLFYHKTAIFLSAFVLIVVTGSLVFATHPAMRSIGVTTLIGMSATILLAYTLQPFVYRLLMKNKLLSHKFGRKPQFKR